MKYNASAILEQYLSDISAIHATRANVAETSFYPALSTLLNAMGDTLAPKVRCVINLKSHGEGLPDGGLFTADQFKVKRGVQVDDDTAFAAQLPARGAIEVKAPGTALLEIAKSDQVKRYWERHGLVLLTNLHAFILVGKDQDGQPALLETYALCATAEEFWHLAAHPQSTAKQHAAGLVEYLLRVMLHNAPLASPQDVAGILASYARDAKARVERAQVPALGALRTALEESLGLHFTGDKGDHFFRSTLVQTLFYGVFSAWVISARRHASKAAHGALFKDTLHEAAAAYTADGTHFHWQMAGWFLRVPMIRALFEQVATPSKLGPLGLVEVLDWTAAALDRVDQNSFFKAFDEGHAVQYFYEPFLQAFDPELRKDLGVWYTPGEIVDYQVERVDTVLREELAIPDGLADPRVVVLDPCCGTAAYLRSVLCRIAKTLHEKGGDALVAHDLKKAAIERVFGFEILPAPFVISHLQIGLLLETLGAPLSEEKNERIGVYLTNALTGWEPPKEQPKQQILLPELAEEHDAADKVKQEKPILVILGNPPYNAFAGVSPEEENDLVEPYKQGLVSEWGIKKFNLDDLYVRFFRLAEKRIAEKGGRGVVSFISNHSWISDPSFVVMRKRFHDEFDAMWFDCMNGDSRETGKLTPEGKPDPSVFSTEWNREGIRVGTAISVLVKREGKACTRKAGQQAIPNPPTIRFRNFWGKTKNSDVLASVKAKRFNAQYAAAQPTCDNRWSFRPQNVSAQYQQWPRITEFSAEPPCNGPIERRGNSLVVMPHERTRLDAVAEYLDPSVKDEEIARIAPEFMTSSGEFKADKARQALKGKLQFDPGKIVEYPFKPFDTRLAYLDPDLQPLFSRPSPQLLQYAFKGNAFFITRDTADKTPEGPPFYFSRLVCDYDCISGHARHFPLFIQQRMLREPRAAYLPGLSKPEGARANLSDMARAYLKSIGMPDPDKSPDAAAALWLHSLAIGFSPAYLKENADGIRQDWPRIPLPATKDLLLASAELGKTIAALLDTETPVPGVTTGTIRDDLKTIAVFTRVDGKPVNPDGGDLDLTAGWGHAGKAGVTMPGKGRIVEHNQDCVPQVTGVKVTSDKADDSVTGAKVTGDEEVGSLTYRKRSECPTLTGSEANALHAQTHRSLDIFLNDLCCWQTMPEPVWDYTIGGYQVIKKWLSYREKSLLGRSLTIEEVRYVTEMARRIAAVASYEQELDDNYDVLSHKTHSWKK